MNNQLQLIQKMYSKFNIAPHEVKFTDKEKQFRIAAMLEEIEEYRESDTREEELDALVDLVVFALGTLYRQGMLHVFEEAFKRVMAANLYKKLGANQKRGAFKLDLVKPENYQHPDLSDLV